MLISEIYHSRQGEGLLSGTPSVFVRTSGCNLRCDFCDTPFTSWQPQGNSMQISEIVRQVQQVARLPLPPRIDGVAERNGDEAKHVVLTGGEPMLPQTVGQLCHAFHEVGFHITIETAGTIDRLLICDLVSISPKLSNSTPSEQRAGRWSARHETTRYRPNVVASLIGRHEYQLKFVVAGSEDLIEIETLLDELGSVDRSRVLLMPEGVDASVLDQRADWLEELCLQRGFQFCQRQHIYWYGNKRAT